MIMVAVSQPLVQRLVVYGVSAGLSAIVSLGFNKLLSTPVKLTCDTHATDDQEKYNASIIYAVAGAFNHAMINGYFCVQAAAPVLGLWVQNLLLPKA